MPGSQASSLFGPGRGCGRGLSCSSSPQALLPSAAPAELSSFLACQWEPAAGLGDLCTVRGPRHGHVRTRRPRQALCPLLQNCKVFGKGHAPRMFIQKGKVPVLRPTAGHSLKESARSQSSVHIGDVPGLPSN